MIDSAFQSDEDHECEVLSPIFQSNEVNKCSLYESNKCQVNSFRPIYTSQVQRKPKNKNMSRSLVNNQFTQCEMTDLDFQLRPYLQSKKEKSSEQSTNHQKQKTKAVLLNDSSLRNRVNMLHYAGNFHSKSFKTLNQRKIEQLLQITPIIVKQEGKKNESQKHKNNKIASKTSEQMEKTSDSSQQPTKTIHSKIDNYMTHSNFEKLHFYNRSRNNNNIKNRKSQNCGQIYKSPAQTTTCENEDSYEDMTLQNLKNHIQEDQLQFPSKKKVLKNKSAAFDLNELVKKLQFGKNEKIKNGNCLMHKSMQPINEKSNQNFKEEKGKISCLSYNQFLDQIQQPNQKKTNQSNKSSNLKFFQEQYPLEFFSKPFNSPHLLQSPQNKCGSNVNIEERVRSSMPTAHSSSRSIRSQNQFHYKHLSSYTSPRKLVSPKGSTFTPQKFASKEQFTSDLKIEEKNTENNKKQHEQIQDKQNQNSEKLHEQRKIQQSQLRNLKRFLQPQYFENLNKHKQSDYTCIQEFQTIQNQMNLDKMRGNYQFKEDFFSQFMQRKSTLQDIKQMNIKVV